MFPISGNFSNVKEGKTPFHIGHCFLGSTVCRRFAVLTEEIQCSSLFLIHKAGSTDNSIRNCTRKTTEVSDSFGKRTFRIWINIAGDSSVKCRTKIHGDAGIPEVNGSPLCTFFDTCHGKLTFHLVCNHLYSRCPGRRCNSGHSSGKDQTISKTELTKFGRKVVFSHWRCHLFGGNTCLKTAVRKGDNKVPNLIRRVHCSNNTRTSDNKIQIVFNAQIGIVMTFD